MEPVLVGRDVLMHFEENFFKVAHVNIIRLKIMSEKYLSDVNFTSRVLS